MLSLIRFELEKILQKKLIIITLFLMVLFTFTMIYNWIAPECSWVVSEDNGQLVTLKGREALLTNQEICARYAGPLTDEKVQQILDEYHWSEEIIANSELQINNMPAYSHNLMYNAFSSSGFTDADGLYNGQSIQQGYGEIAPQLTLGYYEGWENTLYALTYILLSWGCVVSILLSPLFSDEYTRGTDALILTGAKGRTMASTAKLLTAFAIVLAGTLLIILSATLALLLYHGTVGFDASVQITGFGFLAGTPYVLSWGTAYAFACLLWIGAIIVLSSVTLLISAAVRSSFTALVASFAFYVVPMFIPWSLLHLNVVGVLFPINQMQLRPQLFLDKLQVGTLSFPIMWLVIPLTAIILVLCVYFSKRLFARHQVL